MNKSKSRLQKRLYTVIFESDTRAGKAFDVSLLALVTLSVVIICLSSVESINNRYGQALSLINGCVTVLFSIEYVLRIYCSPRPWKYIISFFGIVDLFAIVPGYIAFFIHATSALMVIRVFRLLRIFVVFKLSRFITQANILLEALARGFRKIVVFMGTLLTIVIIMGALMYIIEGPQYGFTSIPKAMYWAIVTLTTVGYGDIAPQTVPGQTVAAIIMLLGYAIIAVPTGILSAEMINVSRLANRLCPGCGKRFHNQSALFCDHCGQGLPTLSE